ncbi:hypothetical protein MKX01_010633, partial [Papaver californicum]
MLNEVKKRMKELRRNSSVVWIPEEEDNGTTSYNSGGLGILGHEVERQPVPPSLMTSTSERRQWFDLPPNERRQLEFTFSFPVRHTSANSGWKRCDHMFRRVYDSMVKIGLDMRVETLVSLSFKWLKYFCFVQMLADHLRLSRCTFCKGISMHMQQAHGRLKDGRFLKRIHLS